MDSYSLDNEKLVLNIIDTPGLFEHHSDKDIIRTNQVIMEVIARCVNLEITKFHMICICVAITAGINTEDIKSIQLFMKHLGSEAQSNLCLIVTHAELYDAARRESIISDLQKDMHFREIASYFKKGIFFSGILDPDTVKRGYQEILVDQFKTICEYREQLINLFKDATDAYQLSQALISEIQQERKNTHKRIKQLEHELSSVRNRPWWRFMQHKKT